MIFFQRSGWSVSQSLNSIFTSELIEKRAYWFMMRLSMEGGSKKKGKDCMVLNLRMEGILSSIISTVNMSAPSALSALSSSSGRSW